MTRPPASLSLDLDNLWAYQMTHGDEAWRAHGSYLDVAVPLLLDEMARLGLTITIFVVGMSRRRGVIAAGTCAVSPDANGRSSCRTSAIEPYRAAGSFSSIRLTTRANPSGTSGES